MPPVVVVAIVAIALSLGALAWTVLAGPDTVHQRTVTNLRRGLSADTSATEDSGSEGPANPALAAVVQRLTPAGTVRRMERLLVRAGRPPEWPLERLLAAKLVLVVIIGALNVLYISGSPGGLALLVGSCATLVSYFLPELLLYSRGKERSDKIALELADTLDQMTIAVEAGLGFDSAMARAGKNGTGPLAQELVRTLQDMQVGQSRREAYESLASRTGVADLRRFVRSVIQADMYGIAIADVLRTQAAEMRMKRRQRAEEKAMQIPVKVIFPLIMCILPVLFIVLLGPAALDIVEAFS